MKIALTILITVAIVAAFTFTPYLVGRLEFGWDRHYDNLDTVLCWIIGFWSCIVISFVTVLIFRLVKLIYNAL